MLRRNGNRLFCEECSDYAYYDTGLLEVNDALNDLDAVTQDNARLAEESAHSAQHMDTNAGILRRTLDVFRM